MMADPLPLRVGVAEDRNRRCRRTMEDAHACELNFGGIAGQGLFAIFDGHGGKAAAEWCGENISRLVLERLKDRNMSGSEALNDAFVYADSQLGSANGIMSGCTAVAALLLANHEDHTETVILLIIIKIVAIETHLIHGERWRCPSCSLVRSILLLRFVLTLNVLVEKVKL